jgi:hypothetical protein
LAKSFRQVAPSPCHIAKSFRKVARWFGHIAKPLRQVAKRLRNLTKDPGSACSFGNDRFPKIIRLRNAFKPFGKRLAESPPSVNKQQQMTARKQNTYLKEPTL